MANNMINSPMVAVHQGFLDTMAHSMETNATSCESLLDAVGHSDAWIVTILDLTNSLMENHAAQIAEDADQIRDLGLDLRQARQEIRQRDILDEFRAQRIEELQSDVDAMQSLIKEQKAMIEDQRRRIRDLESAAATQ